MALFFSDDVPAGQAPAVPGFRLTIRFASTRTDAPVGAAEGIEWKTQTVYHSMDTQNDNYLQRPLFANASLLFSWHKRFTPRCW